MSEQNEDYYYTSSLTMASAAVEQGFEAIEAGAYPLKEMNDYAWMLPSLMGGTLKELLRHGLFCWRFPKTPHNVGLMEPQEHDIIVRKHDETWNFPQVGIGYVENNKVCFLKNDCTEPFTSDGHTIIYRNNIPFPVWDKE